MPVLGVTTPPVFRIRNSASATHCLSTQACQPNSSSSLVVRQCDDWNHDTCANFAGQIWQPHAINVGTAHMIVANVTQNNSDPQSARLCLTAPRSAAATSPGDTDPSAVWLEPCTHAADRQAWKWVIDPQSSGDAHPDHPGTQIESMSREGQCLSSSFTSQEMNEVYAGKLESKDKPGTHEGSWVLAFFNRSPLARPITVDMHRLEFTGRVSVNSWTGTDIWAQDSSNKDMGTLRSSDGPPDTRGCST